MLLFQIHDRVTFATIQNPAVYLSGARVSIFSTCFHDYRGSLMKPKWQKLASLAEELCTL